MKTSYVTINGMSFTTRFKYSCFDSLKIPIYSIILGGHLHSKLLNQKLNGSRKTSHYEQFQKDAFKIKITSLRKTVTFICPPNSKLITLTLSHSTPTWTDLCATISFKGFVIQFVTVLDNLLIGVSKFEDFKVWVPCIRKA